MKNKQILTIEYTVNTSPNILYYRIENPDGLQEWFADKVTVNNNIFTFTWSNSEQKAEQTEKKINEFVRYKWLGADDDSYFEMRIVKQELSGEVALIITDFASESEIQDLKDMWDEQIAELKHTLGV